MDNNNRRAMQDSASAVDGCGDWRSQLQDESRQQIVDKIMDILKRHVLISGQEGLYELKKIVVRFEEKIYTTATSQVDYLMKISMKMHILEKNHPMPNAVPFNSANIGMNPHDPASLDSAAQTGNADGGDWQEETYQKIKSMKDMYFLDLNGMNQEVTPIINQQESLLLKEPHLQQGKNLMVRAFKNLLESFISLLQVPKCSIHIGYKDKLDIYEKQIMKIIDFYKSRKPIPHVGLGETMQQNVENLQQNSSSPISRISEAEKIIKNLLHPSSALGREHINSMNSVQKVATGPLQQNPVSVPQRASVNLISSQSGMTSLKANLNSLQPSSSMLLQKQDQLLQNQHLKQFQHHKMQQNIMHKQLMQQQQQSKQTEPEKPAWKHSDHSPMVDHMSDSTDSKTRQELSVKSRHFQWSAYHQQLKPGNQFSNSLPQVLQPASRHISHHESPQADQQNRLITLSKAGTPLQLANSPVNVPSPSTPAVPSPMLRESEKVNFGSLFKAGNVGHQTVGALVPAQSLAIGTPGISASPLLDEYTSPEAHHAIPATVDLQLQAKSMTSKENKRGMTTDISSESSLNDSFKQLNGLYLLDLDSNATSTAKKPRIEVNHALSEEIREINLLLKDTVVNIIDEADPTVMAGTVVNCSSAAALSPNLKSKYVNSKMSHIHPIKLLVPKDYPNCSPLIFEKLPMCEEHEGLSMKARSRFLITLQSLSQPLSIKDIAKTWDVCARHVISEFAQQSGGEI